MKVLQRKWYWARRRTDKKVEVYSGPFDTKRAAWNTGMPYVYGVETLSGKKITERYTEEMIIDKSPEAKELTP